MTRLLVSVRNLDEAKIAISAGVTIIDLKEPKKGSLGAVSSDTATKVLKHLKQHDIASSIALGEWHRPELAPAHVARLKPDFAKLGMSKTRRHNKWQISWNQTMDETQSQKVTAAYADHLAANSQPPEKLLDFAIESQCNVFLFDTYSKSGGDLLEHVSLNALQQFIQRCRDAKMLVALAGSLRQSTIDKILPLDPDIIAVRSAVCESDRNSTICEHKCKKLIRLLNSN